MSRTNPRYFKLDNVVENFGNKNNNAEYFQSNNSQTKYRIEKTVAFN